MIITNLQENFFQSLLLIKLKMVNKSMDFLKINLDKKMIYLLYRKKICFLEL